VFDPRGGYWQPAESSCPSDHRDSLCHREAPAEHRSHQEDAKARSAPAEAVDEKRAEFQARARQADALPVALPEGAQLCGRCKHRRVVMMDGCLTCLNCGELEMRMN